MEEAVAQPLVRTRLLEFVAELAEQSPTLECGAGSKFQGLLAGQETKFVEESLIAFDVTVWQDQPPDLLADIRAMPFETGTVGSLICQSVLEHVPEPWLAVDEMFRVLRAGGRALVIAPFLYPYHGNSIFRDYYRFTEDGLRFLFRRFQHVEIFYDGGYWTTTMAFNLGLLMGIPVVNRLNFWWGPYNKHVLPLIVRLEQWLRHHLGRRISDRLLWSTPEKQSHYYYVWAKK